MLFAPYNMPMRLLYVAVYVSGLFFVTAEYYSILGTHHPLSVRLPAAGHLHYFQIGATTSKASVNIQIYLLRGCHLIGPLVKCTITAYYIVEGGRFPVNSGCKGCLSKAPSPRPVFSLSLSSPPLFSLCFFRSPPSTRSLFLSAPPPPWVLSPRCQQ